MGSINSKIQYWTEIAEYDLTTAEAMLETKRYLYVGFMCYQAIEKILKAVYVQRFPNETPPFTHDLLKLMKLMSLYDDMSEEQKNTIRILEPLNIDSRYPRSKFALSSSLNNQRCIDIIQRTKGLFQWIKQQLSK
jgi:HEPN domain-containing protein